MAFIRTFFNPSSVQKLCYLFKPWAAISTLICFALGLYLAWYQAPLDYQHGITVRILYIHVPASWLALAIFTAMGVLSAFTLIGKLPVAFLMVKALCPIGLTFTTLSLITGALWGQPAWGTWWVWDARLTSMAILLVQYWGCFLLQQGFRDKKKGLHLTSLFVIIGTLNIPIIKWSVNWWATLHQPSSVMTRAGTGLHSSFVAPLTAMALGCVAYTLWVFTLRLLGELHQASGQLDPKGTGLER